MYLRFATWEDFRNDLWHRQSKVMSTFPCPPYKYILSMNYNQPLVHPLARQRDNSGILSSDPPNLVMGRYLSPVLSIIFAK